MCTWSCGSQSRHPMISQADPVIRGVKPTTPIHLPVLPATQLASARRDKLTRPLLVKRSRLPTKSPIKMHSERGAPKVSARDASMIWLRFAVLQQSYHPSDQLPAQAISGLAKYPLVLVDGTPIEPSTARLLRSAPHRSWLVTNHRSVACIVQEELVLNSDQSSYNTECIPQSEVVSGWLIVTLTNAPGQRGVAIEGVVPNDVSLVILKANGGRLSRVRVRANSYAISAERPEEITYHLGRRRYNIPVPTAPHTTTPLLPGSQDTPIE